MGLLTHTQFSLFWPVEYLWVIEVIIVELFLSVMAQIGLGKVNVGVSKVIIDINEGLARTVRNDFHS